MDLKIGPENGENAQKHWVQRASARKADSKTASIWVPENLECGYTACWIRDGSKPSLDQGLQMDRASQFEGAT